VSDLYWEKGLRVRSLLLLFFFKTLTHFSSSPSHSSGGVERNNARIAFYKLISILQDIYRDRLKGVGGRDIGILKIHLDKLAI
jgi:hypothetical protein